MTHALKKLSAMSGANKLRFAGKIYGSERDYWVVSGELVEDTDSAAGCEARGKGCNSQVFWVTDNILHDWI